MDGWLSKRGDILKRVSRFQVEKMLQYSPKHLNLTVKNPRNIGKHHSNGQELEQLEEGGPTQYTVAQGVCFLKPDEEIPWDPSGRWWVSLKKSGVKKKWMG